MRLKTKNMTAQLELTPSFQTPNHNPAISPPLRLPLLNFPLPGPNSRKFVKFVSHQSRSQTCNLQLSTFNPTGSNRQFIFEAPRLRLPLMTIKHL